MDEGFQKALPGVALASCLPMISTTMKPDYTRRHVVMYCGMRAIASGMMCHCTVQAQLSNMPYAIGKLWIQHHRASPNMQVVCIQADMGPCRCQPCAWQVKM